MSKHLGNVLEPIGLMDEHGADAVRWFMLASGSPWQARRVGHAAIGDVVRKTLLTYWNTVSFLSLYARAADWEPRQGTPPEAARTVMDRWVLAEAERVGREVDAALADFDTARGGRLLAAFVDDLSNWYVRRSRRRFWDGDPAALATLHDALRTVTLCMAPFTPFITERVWQDLFRSTDEGAPASVHLASWPSPRDDRLDPTLTEHMRTVRRIVELGRAARAESGVKTRQPLARALVSSAEWAGMPADLRDEVASELNVLAVESLDDSGDLVDVQVKANFRTLGQRFAASTPAVASAIAATDPHRLVNSIREAGSFTLDVPGIGSVTIALDDIIITESPREGWSVASDAGESVALDLAITEELRYAGMARDLVRVIQEGRKAAGLDITDRITLWWQSDDPSIREAWSRHGAEIAAEILAEEVSTDAAPTSAYSIDVDDPIRLSLARR